MKRHITKVFVASLLVLSIWVCGSFSGAISLSVFPKLVHGASTSVDCWADVTISTDTLPPGLKGFEVPETPSSLELPGWQGLTGNGSALFMIMASKEDPEAKSWALFYEKGVDYFYLATDGEYGSPFILEHKYLIFGRVCEDRREDLYLYFDKTNPHWTAYVQ